MPIASVRDLKRNDIHTTYIINRIYCGLSPRIAGSPRYLCFWHQFTSFPQVKIHKLYDINSLLGNPTSRFSRDRGRARVGIPLRDPPAICDGVPHRAHSIGIEIMMR
jgi:hypothetical protein